MLASHIIICFIDSNSTATRRAKELMMTIEIEKDVPLHILAEQIVTNDFDGLPATDAPYYSNDEWQTAAQCALDGDYSDLDFMLRFGKAHAVWMRKTEAFQMRWAEDCRTWFDAIGDHQFPSGLGVAA